MIRLSWVKSEIEKSLRGEASAKKVYDLAALLTVRAYLAAPSESVQVEPAKEEAPKVYLPDYCADLDKVPKLYNKKCKKKYPKKLNLLLTSN